VLKTLEAVRREFNSSAIASKKVSLAI